MKLKSFIALVTLNLINLNSYTYAADEAIETTYAHPVSHFGSLFKPTGLSCMAWLGELETQRLEAQERNDEKMLRAICLETKQTIAGKYGISSRSATPEERALIIQTIQRNTLLAPAALFSADEYGDPKLGKGKFSADLLITSRKSETFKNHMAAVLTIEAVARLSMIKKDFYDTWCPSRTSSRTEKEFVEEVAQEISGQVHKSGWIHRGEMHRFLQMEYTQELISQTFQLLEVTSPLDFSGVEEEFARFRASVSSPDDKTTQRYAVRGSASANYLIYVRLKNGKREEKTSSIDRVASYDGILPYLLRSFGQDHVPSIKSLGLYYADLNNYQKAAFYLRNAMERGDQSAAYELSCILRTTSKDPAKIEEGQQLLKRLAEERVSRAMRAYGLILLKEYKTKEEGLDLIRQASEMGDTKAQLEYGKILVQRKELAKGIEQVKKAADAGLDEAKTEYYILTQKYPQEMGEPEKLFGLAYLKQAAENGHKEAMAYAARLHFDGKIVKKDYKLVRKYFDAIRRYRNNSSVMGFAYDGESTFLLNGELPIIPKLFYMLGVMNRDGIEYAQDRGTALACFRIASSKGYKLATEAYQAMMRGDS